MNHYLAFMSVLFFVCTCLIRRDVVADRTNQHFVPQFYFRHFSSDQRTIGTLLIRDGRTIAHAPLKGQCARKNFYGSKEIEGIFSQIESHQCQAIRAALDIANNASAPMFTPEELSSFLDAVIFQRGRTALEIEKRAAATEKMLLECFKHHLKHSDDVERLDEMLHHIDAGNVSVTEPASTTVLRSISVALESSVAISDLNLCLLRNRTDYPFIFSDAPVVLYNTYCRNVRNRGVLGLQCPGLQIFFPLNPWTLALFIDGDKYKGPFNDYMQHDLVNRSDVSAINALQIHHASNAVYFGDAVHESYVQDLWHAHRLTIKSIRNQCVVGADFWIDGKPPKGNILQMFEPQVRYDLSLSFVECEPIAEHEYVFTPRSPKIHRELQELREDD